MNIIYSECVLVALVIQHALHLRQIVICGLSHKIYTSIPTHLQPFTKYLPATCFGPLGPSSGLIYEQVPLILVHFGIPNCYKDVIKILCAT